MYCISQGFITSLREFGVLLGSVGASGSAGANARFEMALVSYKC